MYSVYKSTNSGREFHMCACTLAGFFVCKLKKLDNNKRSDLVKEGEEEEEEEEEEEKVQAVGKGGKQGDAVDAVPKLKVRG